MKRIKRKELVYVRVWTRRGGSDVAVWEQVAKAVQIGDGRLLAERLFNGSVVVERGDWKTKDVDRRGRAIVNGRVVGTGSMRLGGRRVEA